MCSAILRLAMKIPRNSGRPTGNNQKQTISEQFRRGDELQWKIMGVEEREEEEESDSAAQLEDLVRDPSMFCNCRSGL